jgi:hypothetical protein
MLKTKKTKKQNLSVKVTQAGWEQLMLGNASWVPMVCLDVITRRTGTTGP